MNSCTAIVAVVVWNMKAHSWYVGFKWDLFWWGLGGSILNNIGMVTHHLSMSCGPVGPINVFVGLTNIILPITESIYYGMYPRSLEIFAILMSFLGSLFLLIPEMFTGILTWVKLSIKSCMRE